MTPCTSSKPASPSLLAATALVAALAGGSALAAPPVRGVTDTEVVFGMTAGFTGTSRELAFNMKRGIDVAFAVVNDAGGINGRKLRLVGKDHANNPAKALAQAQELVERDHVFALIGNTASAAIEKQLPYCVSQGVMLFGTISGAEALRNDPPDRVVFNFRPGYAEEVYAATRHLIEVRRIKPTQIAFFGQDDAFGESGWRGLSKALRRHRTDPSTVLRTGYKRNTMDVAQAVRAVRSNASRVKAVVMVATHKQAAAFIEKVHDLGLMFANISSVEATELADDLKQLGPRYAEGIIVTQVVPLPSSGASAIIRYREQLSRYAPDGRPDFVSLLSYLSANVLIEGLRRAGRDLTTDKLVDTLEGIQNWDIGIGAPIGFAPSKHDASLKVWGTVLTQDGSVKNLDLELD